MVLQDAVAAASGEVDVVGLLQLVVVKDRSAVATKCLQSRQCSRVCAVVYVAEVKVPMFVGEGHESPHPRRRLVGHLAEP